VNFSVLTYNVLYNKAFLELKNIIDVFHPDIICLQEVDTDEQNLKTIEHLHYNLADFSNSFIKFDKIFGIATFFQKSKFKLIESDAVFLPRSIYEFFLSIIRFLRGGNNPRTLLETNLLFKKANKRITIFNTHLTMLGANGIRLKQLNEGLNFYQAASKKSLIVTGDFNYFPYNRRKLELLMKKHGLKEATRKISYTMQYSRDGKLEQYNFLQRLAAKIYSKLFTDRLKTDYMFYKNLRLKKIERIKVRFSDHFPIIAYFSE